jgi:dihydroflavonol-4-reductase
MRALVTGSTGCLGSNICKHLIDRGIAVRAMVLPGTSTLAIDDLDVERFPGDITRPETLREAMQDCDWVFHTAAVVSYWRGDWEISRRVNVAGTRNVVREALRAGVKRLVYTSTRATLATSTSPDMLADETWPYDPAKNSIPYHATKHQAEQVVLEASKNGLDAVICNPNILFGERDVNLNAATIFRGIRMISPFYMAAGGAGVADVDDVSRGHIAAAERGCRGERYIMNNANLTAKEYLTMAAEVIGARKPTIPIPYPLTIGLAAIMAGAQSTLQRKPPTITPNMNFMRPEYIFSSADKAIRELGYGSTHARVSMEKAYRWLVDHKLL